MYNLKHIINDKHFFEIIDNGFNNVENSKDKKIYILLLLYLLSSEYINTRGKISYNILHEEFISEFIAYDLYEKIID